MQKSFTIIASLLLSFFASLSAQDIVAVDTIEFVASRIQEEPDPNNGEYVFALWGTALEQEWKVQIDYYANAECGTFGDDDFRLTSGGGSYNYIRKSNNDMWMRSFKHLDVTVGLVAGDTQIEINGLIQDYGQWRRVLVHGWIPAPAPKDTVEVDMGVVSEMPNDVMGYELLEAHNDEYSLEFGLSGTSRLHPGTFYMVEMLRPVFVALPSDTIAVAHAQLEVTDGDTEGVLDLCLDLRSESNTLYRIAMHTGDIAATDTVVVNCTKAELQNLESMYGIYQFYGENEEYGVGISVTPGVIRDNLTVVPADSIVLAYTSLVDRKEARQIRISQASAIIEFDEESGLVSELKAELVAPDGVLYRVRMPFEYGDDDDLPAAADTTIVECGQGVGRIDFANGDAGWMGLVLAANEADVHVWVNNELQMTGTFGPDCFDYSRSYVTTYSDDDAVIRFADAQMARLRMDSIDNRLCFTLDVITVANRLYHFTAWMSPKKALTGPRVVYDVSAENESMMVAFRESLVGETSSYHLQLQRADGWTDDGDYLDNAEIWDFKFQQGSINGISGTYGYAAETLEETAHFILEDNTEILLKPLAGTLKIEAGEEITVELDEETTYKTHIYSLEAEFVAPNNIIYRIEGENLLLCADKESGDMLELTEQAWASLKELLWEQGYAVRKVLKNGVMLLETRQGDYRMDGIRNER